MPALDLTRTRTVLEEGCIAGLHLGGQAYVSTTDGRCGQIAVGEARPGEPLTDDHLMLWLSSTKPVLAMAIGQLWQRHLLELDDPIVRHLPEFAAHGKGAITIRHFLTHTGGFRVLSYGWPDEPWEEIIRRLCAARPEPRWVPGEKAGYHMASSWFVLAEVLQRLDGRRFSDYVREEIFLPLGMTDCWIGMPPERYRAYRERLVPIVNTGADPHHVHRWHEELRVTRPSPGGNGYGPIAQLGRLYEALRGRGTLDGQRVLSPQTVEALTARHRVGMLDHTFKAVLDWGLGLIPNSAHGRPDLPYQYGRHASRRTFGHSGYRSSTAFCDPAHGLVVAIAVNGTPLEEAHRERFRRLCEAAYEDAGLGTS